MWVGRRLHVTIYHDLFQAINKIVQSGPSVAICSASIGGQPDESDGMSADSFFALFHI
jgi:hypothetical protein